MKWLICKHKILWNRENIFWLYMQIHKDADLIPLVSKIGYAQLIKAYVFTTQIIKFHLTWWYPKLQTSSNCLWPVCAKPGWKLRRPVFFITWLKLNHASDIWLYYSSRLSMEDQPWCSGGRQDSFYGWCRRSLVGADWSGQTHHGIQLAHCSVGGYCQFTGTYSSGCKYHTIKVHEMFGWCQ